SSRRRHTRFSRDWSSDVCSSDLAITGEGGVGQLVEGRMQAINGLPRRHRNLALGRITALVQQAGADGCLVLGLIQPADDVLVRKIGRASCRERVEISVDAA